MLIPLSWGGVDANRSLKRISSSLMASRSSAGDYTDASIDEQAPDVTPPDAAGVGTRIDLARIDMEALLGAYLVGTQAVTLGKRLDLTDLPEACQQHVLNAKSAGRVWVAWCTEEGPMAAWGDYYGRGRSEKFHRLFVEWWAPSSGHHALRARSDPKRPTEWTFGRGEDWNSR
jgi:hypothetical protein